jgi:hypothetical protein
MRWECERGGGVKRYAIAEEARPLCQCLRTDVPQRALANVHRSSTCSRFACRAGVGTPSNADHLRDASFWRG